MRNTTNKIGWGFINESSDFLTTIEYNGFSIIEIQMIFFFILVYIGLSKIWIAGSFYNCVHIYKYALKYFTVWHIIWSEISKFHDMTTKYSCTSQTAGDFRLYTADFAKL